MDIDYNSTVFMEIKGASSKCERGIYILASGKIVIIRAV
jgi:hypothetical protein